jgi:hypothetical protein
LTGHYLTVRGRAGTRRIRGARGAWGPGLTPPACIRTARANAGLCQPCAHACSHAARLPPPCSQVGGLHQRHRRAVPAGQLRQQHLHLQGRHARGLPGQPDLKVGGCPWGLSLGVKGACAAAGLTGSANIRPPFPLLAAALPLPRTPASRLASPPHPPRRRRPPPRPKGSCARSSTRRARTPRSSPSWSRTTSGCSATPRSSTRRSTRRRAGGLGRAGCLVCTCASPGALVLVHAGARLRVQVCACRCVQCVCPCRLSLPPPRPPAPQPPPRVCPPP